MKQANLVGKLPRDTGNGPLATMAASMRATASLDVEIAEAYQQGFVDALRAVAVAFVAGPRGDGSGMRTMAQVEAQRYGFRSLEAGE